MHKFKGDLINKNFVIKTDYRAFKIVVNKFLLEDTHFILLQFFKFCLYKGSKTPCQITSQKRSYSKKNSVSTLLHLIMTGKKNVEKWKKPIASNSPTLVTADSYAMDAGFTLVTRSKAKLRKQLELITPTRSSASSTRPFTVTPPRPTISSTSNRPFVPSTYSDAIVLVPEIKTYPKKYVSLPEALVEPGYDDPKVNEVVKKACSISSDNFRG